MMTPPNSSISQTDPQKHVHVIFIGGWSPGPLNHIKSFLIRHPSYSRCTTIVEPTTNIPMPPFSGGWCWDWIVLAMILVLGVIVWGFRSISRKTSSMMNHHPIFVTFLYVILLVVWFRIFAALVVRRSIRRGIEIICNEIRERQQRRQQPNGIGGGRKDAFILIGFSWGGAVVAEMMAQHRIAGPDQPSALLIAPTTSLVATIAWQTDAAERVAQRQQQRPIMLRISPGMHQHDDMKEDLDDNDNNVNGRSVYNDRVHVVHGSYDHTFCPHQERWASSAVTLQFLPDNHVFLERTSIRSLISILDHLVTQALANEG